MHHATVDMVGKKCGKLTVIERKGTHPKRGGAMWLCRCECEREKVIEGRLLRDGTTTSCGCVKKGNGRTHGHTNSPTYYSWTSMLARCLNERHHAYKNYGGRGITVCEEWGTFSAFLRDVGERPSLEHELDRIDNNKGYFQGNVRWATRKENARNRRTNKVIALEMTVAEWSEFTGISHIVIRGRLKAGWPVIDALTMPSERGRHYKRRIDESREMNKRRSRTV